MIYYFSGGTDASVSSSNQPNTTEQVVSPSDNVKIENGKQIIEIFARGGFAPRLTVAKANVPTIIRVKTNNTFDCSSSLVIPAIKYYENMSPNGVTDIKLNAQKSGASIRGICAMGMYSFEIRFN